MYSQEYSDNRYEGVYSQSYNGAEHDDDPLWNELKKLSYQLFDSFDFEEKNDEKMNDENKVMEKILFLLNLFRDTKSPIAVITRGKWKNIIFDENCCVKLRDHGVVYTCIKQRKKGQILALLCRIYLLIKSNSYSTKRDLYYKDKAFYGKSYICDNIIDDLCCIMHSSRKQLHILSSPKGLIYGDISFKCNGNYYRCLDHRFGLPITQDMDMIYEIKTDAKFIILVEKEAYFQALINMQIIDKFPTILITAKGFPDIDTRQCVAFLSKKLRIPVLGLFDCNPWGLEIYCVYRFGSCAMAHEADTCTIPQARWMGLLPEDLEYLNLPPEQTDILKEIDINKIHSLKRRPYIKRNPELSEQLDLMLRTNKKVELQAIENPIECYLPQKIRAGSWL